MSGFRTGWYHSEVASTKQHHGSFGAAQKVHDSDFYGLVRTKQCSCKGSLPMARVTVNRASVLDAVYVSIQQSKSAIVASFGGH